MNSVMYGNMALQIFMGSSLSLLWGMVNTLQLIANIPLFNLKFPSNIQFLFSILMTMANLEIIPVDDIMA